MQEQRDLFLHGFSVGQPATSPVGNPAWQRAQRLSLERQADHRRN